MSTNKNDIPFDMNKNPSSEEVSRILNRQLKLSMRKAAEKEHKEAVPSGMKEYKTGDKILDRFEVVFHKQGGMGRVYFCYDHETKRPVAVKTILPKYFRNQAAKEDFKNEALNWLSLEKHYNIVQAYYVMNISHVPAIVLEMIGEDPGYGNTLAEYQEKGYGFSTEEALKLGVQFCDGMMHANDVFARAGKIFVHRDIKPSNIMITRDRVIKITDFGLAQTGAGERRYVGTFGYMSPELFAGKEVDTRSDIYSFGCVLYEMFTHGRRPFEVTWKELKEIEQPALGLYLQKKHVTGEVQDPEPFMQECKVKKEIRGILIKCLEKDKVNRFDSFQHLRDELERLYNELTGKRITVVKGEELNYYELVDKAVSLFQLGRYKGSSDSLDKAIKIFPKNNELWLSKGQILQELGRVEEAIICFNNAIEINPEYEKGWAIKGLVLEQLGRKKEAKFCFDKAIGINPKNEEVWIAKGHVLHYLGKYVEAIACFDKAIEINPENELTWAFRGFTSSKEKKFEEAMYCFDKAIEINPENEKVLFIMGCMLLNFGKHEEANACFNKAYKNNYENAIIWGRKMLNYLGFQGASASFDKTIEIILGNELPWVNKGYTLSNKKKYEEAMACFDKAIEINPELEKSWFGKGRVLRYLVKAEEAMACFDKAIEINPENALTWINKGYTLINLGKYKEAIACFVKAIEINPEYVVASAYGYKSICLENIVNYKETYHCLKKAMEYYWGTLKR